MKTLKKIGASLLALLTFFALSVPAFADVVYEPPMADVSFSFIGLLLIGLLIGGLVLTTAGVIVVLILVTRKRK